MNQDKIYVTTMYRYGDTEAHSYVQYAGKSQEDAIEYGDKEIEHRGGKYKYQVVEFYGDGQILKTYKMV